jgi:hypothetical protein
MARQAWLVSPPVFLTASSTFSLSKHAVPRGIISARRSIGAGSHSRVVIDMAKFAQRLR